MRLQISCYARKVRPYEAKLSVFTPGIALGQQVIIEKDSKEVAIILPKKQKTDWAAFRKASKAVHGILKGYSIDEIAPLRKN